LSTVIFRKVWKK
jgi:hypothetical protein